MRHFNNFGNTCFISATIQALFHLKPFINQLILKEYDTELLNELINLYSSLCSNKVSRNEIDLQAKRFILSCKNINFVQNLTRLDDGIGFLMQQDAQEFFDALLKQINIDVYETTIPWVSQNTDKKIKKGSFTRV